MQLTSPITHKIATLLAIASLEIHSLSQNLMTLKMYWVAPEQVVLLTP
jgi:hypothetical protein